MYAESAISIGLRACPHFPCFFWYIPDRFLYIILTLQELAQERAVDDDYWFGLTHVDDVDNPQWLDGSPLGDFTAWDHFGPFDEAFPCVRLRRDSDYLWNDRDCDSKFGYICELESKSFD